LEPEPRPGIWQRFENAIKHEVFEVMSLSLIIANTILMAFQQQYIGYDLGYEVGFRDYRLPAEDFWPWAQPCFDLLEPIFAILFSIEILVKLTVFRKEFFFSLWSYLDIAVSVVMLMSWLVPNMNAGHSRLSFARLARFGKMARIAGKTQTAHFMSESLKLIVAAIKGSFVILFWSLSIMVLLQILAGMTLGSLVEPFLRDEDQPDDIRYRVFKYYGTFWRSMVTMFEVSLANWAPACRVLFDEVDEAFSYFFLFYRCVIGFAVLSVIQAVFIQQTMKSIQLDDNTILEHQRQQKEKSLQKLRTVFVKLDTDQDGFLTWEEFQPLLHDDRMKLTIDSLDLEAQDLKKMFHLMDKGDGKISWEELHEGLPHIKGGARSVDMVSCMNTVDRLEMKMGDILYGKSIVLDSFNI
jgi:Ca2+-binding EF-hand superfamily protein